MGGQTNMKTLTKWMLAALSFTAVVGCDPFTEAVGGTPAVMTAGFTIDGPTAYEGTGSGPTWTISGIPSVCSAPGVVNQTGFIYVKFNKLLDGGSIQTSPGSCQPAAALNLAVTPAAPPTFAWYACYNPQAPAPTEGASVIIFLGPAAAPPSGWQLGTDALEIPTSGDVVTVVHATGDAHDTGGAAAHFDVTANFDPDPGPPGAPSFSNFTPATNPTAFDVSWTVAPCAAAGATYTLQRAPNVPTGTPPVDAPGTWADIATGLTATTYHDSGLTAGAVYWYRVRAVTTTAFPGPYSDQRTQKPAAPAAPTFTNFTATTLTVNWTATASAVTYNVQRAPDNAGVPGTWADVATGLTGLTFNDTGLTTGSKYWYRTVAVNPYGSTTGAQASTTPATPAAPTFTNIAATSLTVNWTANNNTATYNVQRAPDVSGSPGTWADVATGLTVLTFNDTSLTTGSRYWYRIVAVNPFSAAVNGASASVTPLTPPTAPTFSGVTATSVTVNWTAVTGAVGYNVQRAPDVSGAPGTFATRNATALTGTTYTDVTVTATTYWYRVVALAADGTPVPGPSASVTTP
ncbi:MAG TPA: fibronectin type III domain-containing protein [Anaeromyxobacteraceae bacterium]|nr:fibronectin type III domain-containing protein [Anaeromyxobacteraceae bacterium]